MTRRRFLEGVLAYGLAAAPGVGLVARAAQRLSAMRWVPMASFYRLGSATGPRQFATWEQAGRAIRNHRVQPVNPHVSDAYYQTLAKRVP